MQKWSWKKRRTTEFPSNLRLAYLFVVAFLPPRCPRGRDYVRPISLRHLNQIQRRAAPPALRQTNVDRPIPLTRCGQWRTRTKTSRNAFVLPATHASLLLLHSSVNLPTLRKIEKLVVLQYSPPPPPPPGSANQLCFSLPAAAQKPGGGILLIDRARSLTEMGNCAGGAARSRSRSFEGHRESPYKSENHPNHNVNQNTNHGYGGNSQPPVTSKAPQQQQQQQQQGNVTPKSLPIGPVLGRPMEDVRGIYTLGKELGRGQFGVTHLCTHKVSGEQLACKTIAKRKLVHKDDIEDVRREVQIMYHLTGQPNIVELKGAYEDKHSVHLVMECCAGGELFDRIIAKGFYTEKAAAALCRTIVQVVHTCHAMGVAHRDLKPENFLLLNKDENAPLKATDFGLSVFFKPGEVFRDVVGSAYYVAPEVLKRDYGPKVDVWSAGVILYILLSGVPPFWAESEQGIFDAILRGHIDFVSDPWPSISSGAKDLVKKMLTSNPNDRPSAAEVLSHPWIKEDGEAPDKPLDNAVLTRMKQFRAMNKLKKVALKVIAENLSEEEIMGLKEMFKSMDTDKSGTITFEELKTGLARQGSKISESEVRQLMEAADVDGNGTIDYIEFITATMHMNRMEREDHLYTAFQYFDKDNSGYITMDELEQGLRKYKIGDEETIKDIISEVDTDNDGRINYDEFVAMMKKGNPEVNAKKRH